MGHVTLLQSLSSRVGRRVSPISCLAPPNPGEDNQPTLHADVRTSLDDPKSRLSMAKPVADADHGRIETRTATVSSDIDWLRETHLTRTRETSAMTTSETAYYLLATAMTPELFGAVRILTMPSTHSETMASTCSDPNASTVLI